MKVRRHQRMLENAINTVLKAISEELNDEAIKRKGIKLKSLYEAAIQSENKVQ